MPSRLELSGLHRADEEHPDGIVVVPWRSRKLLICNMTCQEAFAPSYSAHTTREAGAVAVLAEERKVAKYVNLTPEHRFFPIAVETMGVLGLRTKVLLRDLRHWVTQTTREEAATIYLVQRQSVAVQRGNCASVMGTTGQLNSGLFY